MNLHQWRAWPANAIVDDGDLHSVDPSRTWVPSPELQPHPLPTENTADDDEQEESRVIPGTIRPLQPNRLSPVPQIREEESDPLRLRRSRFSLRQLVGKLGLKVRKKKVIHHGQSLYGEQRKVLPGEWKAYGQWARPRIGNVMVRNATPPPEPYNLTAKQIEHVMRSVQGPDGSPHPERWISRLEHPALPPQPSLWATPASSFPSSPPPPCNLQLNPFLEHRLTGVPPIMFDIRFKPHSIILGEAPPNTPSPSSPSTSSSSSSGSHHARFIMFDPEGPNGLQPATYPGLPALTICALADEMTSHFPWPVLAICADNSLPVTVRDVLRAVYLNFQEYMTEEELGSLTRLRRSQVERAYLQRVRDLPGCPADDGIRRVDFLGDRCIFRGIESVKDGDGDGEGFVLFVGPPQ